jgi:hypothetical protein
MHTATTTTTMAATVCMEAKESLFGYTVGVWNYSFYPSGFLLKVVRIMWYIQNEEENL